MVGEVEIGARRVPLSPFISEEARQALMAPPLKLLDRDSQPALDDIEGWRDYISRDNAVMQALEQQALPMLDVSIERTRLNGTRVAWVRPNTPSPAFAGKILMNIHGGGFILGEGSVFEAAVVAHLGGVDVLAVDYRVPPEHRYPASLEDSLAAYQALLASHGASNIAVFGTSAGGTLAVTTILKARDLGLSLPAAAGICTPLIELSDRWGYAGDTAITNDGLDVLSGVFAGEEGSGGGFLALFRGGASPTDPLLSPIYADFSKGFCPSFLLSGTRDMLLSSTVLTHRAIHRAGAPTELHVFESMQHGFHLNIQLPEAREALHDMLRFFKGHLGIATG